MDLSTALRQLEAAADPSRLRLLALLSEGEAAVGELTEVLAQSQPRVSRHLRLLTEAGLVEAVKEGRRVYYRLAPAATAGGIATLLGRLGAGADATVATDRARMGALRSGRERAALKSLGRQAGAGQAWSEVELAETLDAALGPGALGDVLDVGAGTGTVLRLLGPRARQGLGVDQAPAMRELARSRLRQAGLAHCTVRQGDARDLPCADGSQDLVILDGLLAGAPDPAMLLAEARRVLRPGGRLLILDRVLPVVRRLGPAPRGALHENQLVHLLAAAGFRLVRRHWLPGRAPDQAVLVAVPSPAGDLRRSGTHD